MRIISIFKKLRTENKEPSQVAPFKQYFYIFFFIYLFLKKTDYFDIISFGERGIGQNTAMGAGTNVVNSPCDHDYSTVSHNRTFSDKFSIC